jgi:2-dehydropantoate 2-reductase
MKIAVMGAGGLGAYIGARLSGAGADVAFIARGKHLAAMRSGGLAVESPFGGACLSPVTATDAPVEIGPVDLVLFTVKLWDTEDAAAAIAPLIGPATRVLTLQNGIDSVDLIARHVPGKHIVAGVTYIPAVIAEPGVVRNPGGSKRIVVDRGGGNAVIAAFQDTGGRAVGLEIELTDAIDRIVWEKLIAMSAFAAATALMRSTAGPILANPESRAFLRQLVEDGIGVAAATGNPMPPDFAGNLMAFYDTLPPIQRSSMAADLESGRRLELPWLSGRIHALGVQHGIPTPAHTAAFRGLVLHAGGRGPNR